MSGREHPSVMWREHNENIHKFERKRLAGLCDKAGKLFVQQSVPNCKTIHKKLHSWLVLVVKYENQHRFFNIKLLILKLL